jgi:two-component system LytT family response regulator
MKVPKIKALIVDDERLARRFIRLMLKDDHDVEIIGECRNGREAVTAIKESEPDLVFLDVQMPEMDGFAVLETLGPAQVPKVVFTTAYEQYAIQAFELHALDYLLKPFDQTRFRKMLEHAKEQLRRRPYEDRREKVSALLENVRSQSEYLGRVSFKVEGRILFLKTEEIDWIEADDKYVHLHSGKTRRMVRQTLSALEKQLDPKRFLRIHRSTIVNIERIKELHPLSAGGEHVVVLEDGTRLNLSRNYKDDLFVLLGKPL